MLSSLPYGSSSLTQDKIPVSIPNSDHNRNNAPIYEVTPRYPLDVLAISNTFFFFFLKILHSFLGSVIRLIECNQKAGKEATIHDQSPCSYSVETVTPKSDVVISGNSCLLFLENRELPLLRAQSTNKQTVPIVYCWSQGA